MPGRPEDEEFVQRLRAGAEADERERIEYWRNAPVEEHARVLVELLNMTDRIISARGRPVEKPPLPEDRFPWPSLRARDEP